MSSPNLESLTNELSKFGADLKRSFGETETPKAPPWHHQQTPDEHPNGAPDGTTDGVSDPNPDGFLMDFKKLILRSQFGELAK